jgi:hypothetical protein
VTSFLKPIRCINFHGTKLLSVADPRWMQDGASVLSSLTMKVVERLQFQYHYFAQWAGASGFHFPLAKDTSWHVGLSL